MIDSTWYPADFCEEQCRALDAAAEIEDTQNLAELADYIAAIRGWDFELHPHVEDYYDLGYEYRTITGLNADFEYFFDWAKFGENIDRDSGGHFTPYGWITFN